MRTEFWVYKGNEGAEQAVVIAKFNSLKTCREWCEDEYGEFEHHEGKDYLPAVEDSSVPQIVEVSNY